MDRTIRGCGAAAAALALAALSPSACVGPVELVEVVTWEGQVLPSAGVEEDITGSVAMVANEFTTQVGIGLTDDVGGTYTWAVHEGSCASPGERIGPLDAFPALDLAGDNADDAGTLLNRRVDTRVPYVAVVRSGSDGAGAVRACGALHRNE